jgi:PAS domain S-box-containing protein
MASLSPLGLMLSSKRQIVLCNTAFAHMFGHEIDDMQGASLAMLYPSQDEFERIGQRGWHVMAKEGQYQDERLMRRRDGSLIWLRVHGRAADLANPFETASWVFEPLSAVTDAERLTPREREVLAGMAKGQTSKDSAKELGLSPRTVEKLRASLRAHFGARNAAELMSRIGGMPA